MVNLSLLIGNSLLLLYIKHLKGTISRRIYSNQKISGMFCFNSLSKFGLRVNSVNLAQEVPGVGLRYNGLRQCSCYA